MAWGAGSGCEVGQAGGCQVSQAGDMCQDDGARVPSYSK